MFAYFRAPLGWPELLRRTWSDIRQDRCLGLAAELAFYFLLAAFPAMVVVLSILTLLPTDIVLSRVLDRVAAVAPGEVVAVVREQLRRTMAGPPAGLLTMAVVFAVWSSSTAMTAIIDTLNRAYDIKEYRPWWKMRLLAIGLTLALACFTVVALSLIFGGADLAAWLVSQLGGGDQAARIWVLVQWPLAFVLVVIAVDLIYHFAPNAEARWAWITPGSLLATSLWLAASVGFKLYVGWFGNMGAVYGSLTGVMVLLLWFYLGGLAVLVGAELNAEIDKELPSRDTRPQTPNRRKKIGAAAEAPAQ